MSDEYPPEYDDEGFYDHPNWPGGRLCQQIQEDLLTFLDGMDQSILNGVCQIVVDNFTKDEEN